MSEIKIFHRYLEDFTDKKIIAILRDGRKLIGYLKSYDQFANIVIWDTIERIYSQKYYADIPRGLFVLRGESLVFLGEMEESEESNKKLVESTVEFVLADSRAQMERRDKIEAIKRRIFFESEMESELF